MRLLALAAAAVVSASALPQCVTKQLIFSDGSKACLEIFEPLNLRLSEAASISEQVKNSRTHALAITSAIGACPAASGWSWNSSSDEARAVRFCEQALRRKGLSADCHCQVLVPVNGKVPMPQMQFVQQLFHNTYGFIEQQLITHPAQTTLKTIKEDLEAKELLHTARLMPKPSPLVVTNTGVVVAGANPKYAEPPTNNSLSSAAGAIVKNINSAPSNIAKEPIPQRADSASDQRLGEAKSAGAPPETAQDLRRTCPTHSQLVGRTGMAIDAALTYLESNNFAEASRYADALARNQIEPNYRMNAAEARCVSNMRAAIPAIKAKKEAAEQVAAAPKSCDEGERTRFGHCLSQLDKNILAVQPTCTPSSCPVCEGVPGPVVGDFNKILDAFKAGQFAAAAGAARNLLTWQIPDQRQNDCLRRVSLEGEARSTEQAAQDAAANAKAQQEAATPSGRLKSAYVSYMAMQRCYESRKEFRVQYVSKQEFDTAKAVTKRKEQDLTNASSDLGKRREALWEQSKQNYLNTTAIDLLKIAGADGMVIAVIANNDLALFAAKFSELFGNAGTTFSDRLDKVCKGLATTYTKDQGQQQQQIKKDF